MSYENQVLTKTWLASESLATHQYKAMELSTTTVARTNATTDSAIGILQNNPGSGEAAVVCLLGISKAIAGAAIAAGAKVSVTNDGKLQTAATGQHVLGICVEAAAADGDVFALFVCPGGAPLP